MAETEKTEKPNQMALASKVSKNVEISSVVLTSLHAERNTEDPFQNADIGIHAEAGSTRTESNIVVEIDFTVRISAESDDTQIALIGCTHKLTYQLSGDPPDEIENECVEAFGKLNGLYNCWPYIREIIQSSLTRLGLPAFSLPVMTADRILSVYDSSSANETESAD